MDTPNVFFVFTGRVWNKVKKIAAYFLGATYMGRMLGFPGAGLQGGREMAKQFVSRSSWERLSANVIYCQTIYAGPQKYFGRNLFAAI